MGEFKSYREESKTNWGTRNEAPLTIEQIQCGCMLRIADASEYMSRNFVSLQNDLESTKKSRDYYMEKYHQACASNSALRGVITKLKNGIAAKNKQ